MRGSKEERLLAVKLDQYESRNIDYELQHVFKPLRYSIRTLRLFNKT